jgi:hypothetical protein
MKPPRDIDPDEYRDLVRRAFYMHGDPCESCGRPSRGANSLAVVAKLTATTTQPPDNTDVPKTQCQDCEAIEQARYNCRYLCVMVTGILVVLVIIAKKRKS